MRDARLRATMGRNGKQYVNRNYRWSHVLRKYERLFARLAGPGASTAPTPDRQPDRQPDRPRDRDRDQNRDRGGRDRGDRSRFRRRGGR
jgi:hypothetical protein